MEKTAIEEAKRKAIMLAEGTGLGMDLDFEEEGQTVQKTKNGCLRTKNLQGG